MMQGMVFGGLCIAFLSIVVLHIAFLCVGFLSGVGDTDRHGDIFAAFFIYDIDVGTFDRVYI